MEILSNTYEIENINSVHEKYFTEKTLFFDIECTGLSPRKSFIYLIGYATRVGKEITITQLLAANENEEIEILNEFEKVMESYPNLLGFNSTRFDESFIIERCRKYKLYTKIKTKQHLDMYLQVTKARCLLDLQNYKQKTIEEYLGLHREDKYDGGKLIPVYQHYSLMGDEESKNLILLHNFEDVKGMIHIISILSYPELFTTDLRYINHEIDQDKIRFEVETEVEIPNSINKIRDYGLYIIKENRIYVTLNLFKGNLYTFLPDYKNYYYIESQDMIIPKSLGESMDKSLRRPATRRDCKVCADATYLRIPDKLDAGSSIRLFKPDYDSKESYINVQDIKEDILLKITRYMLKH